ncbi:SIR2 family protein [Rhizobium leguminosarum]|uniref:SIR2 family protein n=1 Tax=Rhizobium leguminosarum TaxID=384 RepID=UPI003CFF1893
MPRFIANGPFVPDELVQQLEEDRVVSFCGAGISAGGGLPGFRDLVEHCYDELSVPVPAKNDPMWGWPDRMLGSLEIDFPDQMRQKVVARLDLPATDLAMHRALLKLARLRNSTDGYRLVTTNFDLFFEQAKANMALDVGFHSAPILPIPRNDHSASWRSIVYLHGRLQPGEGNQHLVLTSADFGRAYLTDAWAARFVARLFAEFTVLFIGYSLNDPVLRYMTDAFAAEDATTRRGFKRSPAYIFVPHKGTQPPDPKSYRQRQLEPIFYREAYHHRALKNTLLEWAKARTDYLASIGSIVRRNGPRLPSALTPSTSSNLVWAICSRPDQGLGARFFADLTPPAPVEWLAQFEERDTQVQKAYAQDVELAAKEGRDRPMAPQLHIEALFPHDTSSMKSEPLGEVSLHLARWFCQHLESKWLVSWTLAKLDQRRRPHPHLRYLIHNRLGRSPNIAQGYVASWRIVSGEGGWARNTHEAFPWSYLSDDTSSFMNSSWFLSELKAALRPSLRLEASYRLVNGDVVDGNDIRTIVDAAVVFSYNDVGLVLDQLDDSPTAQQFWSEGLDWLTNLLQEVLTLYSIVGRADANSDPTVLGRPSIVPHAQNAQKHGWQRIYDFVWKGWIAVDAASGVDSRYWIERWRRIPYPGFRRLVIAAVGHSRHFSAVEKLEVLRHV